MKFICKDQTDLEKVRLHLLSMPLDKPIELTVKEYEQESMKIMRLMQQNKKEEVRRLEAELDAALAEGRVIP